MRRKNPSDIPRGRSIYVRPEVWREWVREAKRDGISVAEALRQAMLAWIERRKGAK
jgi:hypothetical protein